MDVDQFEEHKRRLGSLLKDSIVTDRKHDLLAYRDIGYSASPTRLVVRPKTFEDVASLLSYCNEHSIAVTPWGGGTNLCGALTPSRDCIALDLKSLDKIIELSVQDRYVTVQAGATIEQVEQYLNRFGFTFCHDPWSRKSASVGGALSLDSVGNFYPKFGSFGDQVLSMKVALPDGGIVSVGRNITKSSASPFLPSLFIGAEGLFGVILEATLKVNPLPETFSTLGYAFSSFRELFEAVLSLRNRGVEPQSYIGGTVPKRAVKLQPRSERALVKLLNINAALFLYYDGLSREVDARVQVAEKLLSNHGRKMPEKYAIEWWENRHTYFEMNPQLSGEGIYVHVFDLCIPASHVLEVAGKVREIAGKQNIEDGLSHTLFGGVDAYTVALYVDDTDKGRETVKSMERELIPIVHEAGGSMTRTHGLGTLFEDDVAAFEIGEYGIHLLKGLKQLLDPNGIMNPGILHRRI